MTPDIVRAAIIAPCQTPGHLAGRLIVRARHGPGPRADGPYNRRMSLDPQLERRQRTYALTMRFFAELQTQGIVHVVASPGSRNTPLVLAAQATGLAVEMQIDERVAAFVALGMARTSGLPTVLVCSSGTAGANYLPAVIEANHAGVPLIICTADRPPELRTWGAGQTVSQRDFFGTNTRWSYEMPVASEGRRVGGSLCRYACRRCFARSKPGPRAPQLAFPRAA